MISFWLSFQHKLSSEKDQNMFCKSILFAIIFVAISSQPTRNNCPGQQNCNVENNVNEETYNKTNKSTNGKF